MPSTSVSRVAVRMMPSSGGSQRRPSSIACGMRLRSARSASSWSGLVSSPKSRLLDERYVVSAPAGSSRRRNEQICASSRRCAVELGLHEHRDHVVGGMQAALGDDRAEVVVERVRRRDRAVELEAGADHLDGLAVERGQVFARQAEHARDHEHRERERQAAHEVAALVVDDLVEHLVDDAAHEVALPRLHRLAAERLLHEPAVRVVLGLVHLEDRVAEHRAHDVGVAGRRERLAVLAAPAAPRRSRRR